MSLIIVSTKLMQIIAGAVCGYVGAHLLVMLYRIIKHVFGKKPEVAQIK